MSKRKGVSAEEKRTRMLEIFHETQDFYQLKDLEKLGPKQKGVVAQAVKDVVQSLVDDGLVECEKIGTSLYYWSYPDKAEHALKKLVEKQKVRIVEVQKKVASTKEEIKKEKVGREVSERRTELLNSITTLQGKVEALRSELKKQEDNDPEVWEQRKMEVQNGKEAANRWTDNVFAIKTWVKNKFCLEEAAINKQFGISEDFDYLE